MFSISPGSLLTLALLAGTAKAADPSTVSACTSAPRIDLTVDSAEQALGVCVNLGAPTTFAFGVPLSAGAVVLSDNRSIDFAQGGTFVTVYPKRTFLLGERVKLMVRVKYGPVSEEIAFWLVGQSAQGARSVEVLLHAQPVDALKMEAANARAEASQCQEEKAKLLGERMGRGDVMGVAWLERTEEIHAKDLIDDLKQHPDNALKVEAAMTYSHSRSVAIRLQLFNSSIEPWTTVEAVLADAKGAKVNLSLWQEASIVPGSLGYVVVGSNVGFGQFNCPCSLVLREAEGLRIATLGNITFADADVAKHSARVITP